MDELDISTANLVLHFLVVPETERLVYLWRNVCFLFVLVHLDRRCLYFLDRRLLSDDELQISPVRCRLCDYLLL